MTLKIIAAAVIIAGGFFAGKSVADTMKERRDCLQKLVSALLQMENYIAAVAMPLGRVYERLSDETKVGKMFDKMMKSSETDQKKLWEEATKTLDCLKKEDINPLIELSEVIGASSREHQSAQIDLCIIRLKKRLEEAEHAYGQNGVLCRKMGIYGGILIVILLM
ncbi:MAG: stage III sporulation protein AB [Bacillota bacterium]|nr:stage III sporulation protein AB [Bacillota bacterium]